MAIVNVGRVRPVWQGTWSSSTAYVKDDIVFHDNSSWIATASSTNSAPAISNTDWDQMSVGTPDIPNQAGQGDKFLQTDGSGLSWATVDVAGGSADTTSASANITLTSSSKKTQRIEFTGSGYSVILPDATLLNKGDSFVIYNASLDYSFGVLNGNNGVMTAINPLGGIACSLIDNTTTKGSWEIAILSPQGEFAVVASYTNTDTTSLDTQTADVIDAGALHVKKLAENKWITIWTDVDNNQYKAQAHSYDPSANTVSAGSVITWSGTGLNTNGSGYVSGFSGDCDAVYISDDVVLVTYYKSYDTGDQILGFRTISASGLTLTANAEVTVTESNTNNGRSGFLYLAQNPYSTSTGLMTQSYYNDFNNTVAWSVSGTTVSLGSLYYTNVNGDYGVIPWFTSATTGYMHGYYSDLGPRHVTPFTLSGLSISFGSALADVFAWSTAASSGVNYLNTTDGFFTHSSWSGNYANFAWVSENNGNPNSEIHTLLPNTVKSNEAGIVLESADANTIKLLTVVTSVAGLQGVGPVLRRITIDKASSSYTLGGSSLLASSTINDQSRVNYYCGAVNVLNEIATGRYLHHGTNAQHHTIYNVISSSDK